MIKGFWCLFCGEFTKHEFKKDEKNYETITCLECGKVKNHSWYLYGCPECGADTRQKTTYCTSEICPFEDTEPEDLLSANNTCSKCEHSGTIDGTLLRIENEQYSRWKAMEFG